MRPILQPSLFPAKAGIHECAGKLADCWPWPGQRGMDHPEALGLIANATDLVGYGPYLERLPLKPGQRRHQSGNGAELERARHALRLAEEGRHVALVSGGDPGIFAMAAAVFEAIDEGEPGWRDIDVAVSPGISAMQAAAARIGAPLGMIFAQFPCLTILSLGRSWKSVSRRRQVRIS